MEWMQKSLAIMEQIPKLTIAIRVNITTTNACSITQFIDDLARRHLNNPHFILQLIPVYNWGHDNTQIQLDNTSLDRNMCQWIEQAIANGIQTNILPNTKKDFVCVATNRQAEVIDSRGFIYSCTEFPSSNHMRIWKNSPTSRRFHPITCVQIVYLIHGEI